MLLYLWYRVLSDTDTKHFWRELKGLNWRTVMPNIPDTELYEHFARLNGTEPEMNTAMDTHILNTIDISLRHPRRG